MIQSKHFKLNVIFAIRDFKKDLCTLMRTLETFVYQIANNQNNQQNQYAK